MPVVYRLHVLTPWRALAGGQGAVRRAGGHDQLCRPGQGATGRARPGSERRGLAPLLAPRSSPRRPLSLPADAASAGACDAAAARGCCGADADGGRRCLWSVS
eukprot:3924178-Rhodomonas_salina.5